MLLQPDSKLYILPAAGGKPRLMRSNTLAWHTPRTLSVSASAPCAPTGSWSAGVVTQGRAVKQRSWGKDEATAGKATAGSCSHPRDDRTLRQWQRTVVSARVHSSAEALAFAPYYTDGQPFMKSRAGALLARGGFALSR